MIALDETYSLEYIRWEWVLHWTENGIQHKVSRTTLKRILEQYMKRTVFFAQDVAELYDKLVEVEEMIKEKSKEIAQIKYVSKS